jgi:hypothetical protein
MRTKLRSKISLLFMTCALVLAVPAIALADLVGDSLNGVDATVASKSIVAGDSTSVGYFIRNINTNNGDTQNQCNTADTSPATVTINPPAGSNVTATPGSLTFSGPCDVTQNASFTSEKAGGPYNITVSVSDSGTGQYDATRATWSLTVNKAKTQLTNVLGSGVSGTSTGHVQATLSSFKTDGTTVNKNLAGKTVTFKIDGNTVGTDVTDANGLAERNNLNLSGVSAGGHNLTAEFAEDDGYLASTGNGPMVVAPPPDSTGPEITPNVQGTQGDNGWYKSDVTVSWNVSDPESPVSSSNGCGTTTINTDTAGQTLTCTATSGGGTSSQSVIIMRDATNPNVTAAADRNTPDHNGWYNAPFTVSFSGTDETSGIASCAPDANYSGPDTTGDSLSGSCTDLAGNSASANFNFKYDDTDPTISGTRSPGANGFGWNNGPVSVSYSCSDETSEIASCGPNQTRSSEGAGQSSAGNATDNAGNAASTTVNNINIDLTNPLVSLVGGPDDGSSFYFGINVPNTPTCSASDALSGLAGPCTVGTYATTVGPHTVTATAKDKADNTNSASKSYTVLGWDFRGFYQPVDMGTTANSVKGGSTVPIKFELFAGSNELTETSRVVTPLKATKVACDTGAPIDDIELTATGGTALRYDTTGGQYIYNWQTPKQPGACYDVTITAQDSSSKTAHFKLK